MRFLLALPVFCFAIACSSSQDASHAEWQILLDSIAADSNTPGVLLAFQGPEKAWAGAAGIAEYEGAALHEDAPVRIASNTKTLVAAALLRLWEDDAVELDDPISKYLSAEEIALLASDGYDADAMTLRHLLTHTAGLFDHAQSDAYFQAVFSQPDRVWTPWEQVEGAVDWGDPLGPAGAAFSYSDTGYVLLGLVITRVTEQPLGAAVRSLLDFETLGMTATWWESVEAPPSAVQPRPHQYLDEIDTYAFHPSLDLHGGGGLVASMEDLAGFWHALFNGEVFRKPATLDTMLTSPLGASAVYRMGIFQREMAGFTVYEHSGFWGTEALYIPELDIAIAGAVTQQDAFPSLRALMEESIHRLAN